MAGITQRLLCAVPLIGALVDSCQGSSGQTQTIDIEAEVANSVVASTAMTNIINSSMTLVSRQNITVVTEGCTFNGPFEISQGFTGQMYVTNTSFAEVNATQVNDMQTTITNALDQQAEQTTNALTSILGNGAVPQNASVVLRNAISSAVESNVTVETVSSIVAAADSSNSITWPCRFSTFNDRVGIDQRFTLRVGLENLVSNIVTTIQKNSLVTNLANEVAQSAINKDNSNEVLFYIVLILIIVAVLVGGWYFFFRSPPTDDGGARARAVQQQEAEAQRAAAGAQEQYYEAAPQYSSIGVSPAQQQQYSSIGVNSVAGPQYGSVGSSPYYPPAPANSLATSRGSGRQQQSVSRTSTFVSPTGQSVYNSNYSSSQQQLGNAPNLV